MNKLLLSTAIACGLLLLDAPEAAAHEDRDRQHSSPKYDNYNKAGRGNNGRRSYRREGYKRHDYKRHDYSSRYERGRKMPKWLRGDRSFRHWLERSHLRRDRGLSWHQLFEIYRWELSYRRDHRHF
jgi:hypothetical protein